MVTKSSRSFPRPRQKINMRSKLALILMCAPLMWGCTSTLTALRGNNDHLYEEMKTEIADLKHALHGTEVEVKLLEERLERKETETGKGEVATLQRKIALLEKTIDKMSGDLKSLMTYANQTTASLTEYRDQIQHIDKKLEEVNKLRSTLSQISKTYSSPETPQAFSAYQVKAGDSLEKIARKFHVLVESLKRENNLSSDKIVIGQELMIPSAE
jgi:LysM repeat protein